MRPLCLSLLLRLSFACALSSCEDAGEERSVADSSPGGTDDERSCEDGVQEACFRLALKLEGGHGVARDSGRARALLVAACDEDYLVACTMVGLAYALGDKLGVEQDDDRALSYFRRACDGGEPTGCGSLGSAYQYGRGVAMDLTLAADYYTDACEGGDEPSCEALEELGLSSDGGAGRVRRVHESRGAALAR